MAYSVVSFSLSVNISFIRKEKSRESLNESVL